MADTIKNTGGIEQAARELLLQNKFGPNARMSQADFNDLQYARSLKAGGASDEAILKRSGWDLSGPYPSKRTNGVFTQKRNPGTFSRLGDIADHPSLFNLYPELRNLPVTGALQAFNDDRVLGTYNSPAAGLPAFMYLRPMHNSRFPRTVTSAWDNDPLAHETQHWIDDREGANKAWGLETDSLWTDMAQSVIHKAKTLPRELRILLRMQKEGDIEHSVEEEMAAMERYRSRPWEESAFKAEAIDDKPLRNSKVWPALLEDMRDDLTTSETVKPRR